MEQKLTLWDRLILPTPRFFRKLRALGAALGALGLALTTTPVLLPATVVAIGSYLILAGSVIAAISSVVVEPEGAASYPKHVALNSQPTERPERNAL